MASAEKAGRPSPGHFPLNIGRNPELVDLLLRIAGGIGDAAATERLTKLRDDNLAAAKELDVTW